jgi:hypothetical protein
MSNQPDYDGRYRTDKDKLYKRIDQDNKLIEEFGARIGAFDPGVMLIMSDNRSTLSVDDAWWNWLRPLLNELSEYRTGSG